MSQLLPCPSCGRHVRRTETACPFCASVTAFAPAPSSRTPTERLGRAAIMAFGAAAATTVAACSGSPVPAYGAPAPDAGELDGGPIEADDGGGVDAAYGGPPFDAGADSGLVAAYGGPPDAGTDSGGGAVPAYGAPGLVDAGSDSGGGAVPAYGTPGAE